MKNIEQYSNKVEALVRVCDALVNKTNAPKNWLLVCSNQSEVAWTYAAATIPATLDIYSDSILFKQLIQLEMWLDSNPTPHIIVVEDYDLGVRTVIQSLLERLSDGKHLLFMTRVDSPQSETTKSEEVLDFMKKS